ncbi:phage tail protein [Altericroceibacterium spongiae]|nr:phage tail protein [Altericroceibacterium spongiae]
MALARPVALPFQLKDLSMATLVFTAVGTALGGPLGGALGSLAGQQLDRTLFGHDRQGARLNELAVTTSSYGTAVGRHYGRMRVPGSIIWASELMENAESTGGMKGAAATTQYSYSVSFAVALSSRPVASVGRIWADGNLLRGAAGDLKTGGSFRLYRGGGDNALDPLIASAVGGACPAFRGLAYCVFDTLQLADFGNRIPTLNFELFGEEGEVALVDLLPPETNAKDPALPGLAGFSHEGGSFLDLLATVNSAYPLACNADGNGLTIVSAAQPPAEIPLLPEPARALDGESFGQMTGQHHRRSAAEATIPTAIRYYDPARDYQPGMQRAGGQALPGTTATIQFPGALDAQSARNIVNAARERAGWHSESIAWRLAELDPALGPGSVVRLPGHAGYWRITSWEWRDQGVELELVRLPRGPAREDPAESGTVLSPPDKQATPTLLHAVELPWDGSGNMANRMIYAAPSSISSGWTGAALYTDREGQLHPIGSCGPRRAIIGHSLTALPPSRALRFEREATLDILLAAEDFTLDDASPEQLAAGANRAQIGSEVIQFARATALGGSHWRLSGLLRGRAGSEGDAYAGQQTNSDFTLLDERLVQLDSADISTFEGTRILALGLADDEPVSASLVTPGRSLKPLTPVHPKVTQNGSGDFLCQWTRRARGAWEWRDGVDVPLNEEREAYLVGIGPVDWPDRQWESDMASLTIPAVQLAGGTGKPLWVRQKGQFALSDPLLLTVIS